MQKLDTELKFTFTWYLTNHLTHIRIGNKLYPSGLTTRSHKDDFISKLPQVDRSSYICREQHSRKIICFNALKNCH